MLGNLVVTIDFNTFKHLGSYLNLIVILEIEGWTGICRVKIIKLAQHQSALCSQVCKNISYNHLEANGSQVCV